MQKDEIVKLNTEIEMSLPKLIDSKLLVQANSGGGKSWLLRRILEQSHGKVQQIILDPEGEFATLREKYDYILAGKDSEVPAEPRSAAMLARKLLELNVSAIIDLYELHPQDRKRFVRLFLEAMVNAPKDLWHQCLVVIDEAHTFVPERGESEAADAVIGLCSLGRKRGFSAVLATQRISKLHKDAAAECNNKLIGRTGLDIDRKRAGEELGFTGKEEFLSLRTLKPGEFYAFGPAISDEVIKVSVGSVQTSHPKAGSRSLTKTVPPTDRIKKILGQLSDLPQQAVKEASTVSELHEQIKELRRHKCAPQQPVKVEKIKVPTIGKRTMIGLKKSEAAMRKMIKTGKDQWPVIEAAFEKFSKELGKLPAEQPQILGMPVAVKPDHPKNVVSLRTPRQQVNIRIPEDGRLPIGERKILTATAQHQEGVTREQLTILTGYKRSSRDAYLQRLRERGLINTSGDRISVTQGGLEALGPGFEPLPTGDSLREHWMSRLPVGEKAILSVLIESYPNTVSRDALSESTGYQRSSRDAYLQRLGARRLVEFEGRGSVKASRELFS